MTRSQTENGARDKSRYAGAIEKKATPSSQNLTEEANQEIPRAGPSTRIQENSTNEKGVQYQSNEYANSVCDD